MGCYGLLLLLLWVGSCFGSTITTSSTTSLHHQLQHFDVCFALKSNCSCNLQYFTSKAHNFPREERVPLIPHRTMDNEDSSYMKCPHYFSLEIEAMVDIVRNFQWHEIIFLHQDSESSNQFASELVNSFRDEEILISNKYSFSSSVTYFNTLKILSNVANKQTRIILVDVTDVSVGSQVILAAKEAGLMRKGYGLLFSSRMSKMLNLMDPSILNIMEGALGIRPQLLQCSICENNPRGHSGNIRHSLSFEVFNVLGNTDRVVANWKSDFRFSRDLGAIDDDDDVVKHPNSVKHFKKIIWPGDSTMVPRSCDVPMAIRNGWKWIPR